MEIGKGHKQAGDESEIDILKGEVVVLSCKKTYLVDEIHGDQAGSV